MAVIPVLTKDTRTQEVDKLLNARIKAFSDVLEKMNISEEKKISKLIDMETRNKKELEGNKKKTDYLLKKKEVSKEYDEMKKELELLKQEFAITNNMDTKVSIDKLEKKMDLLKKVEGNYDAKIAKTNKQAEKKIIWHQKSVIGLLNPVAKGILAGGKGIVQAIGGQVEKNKDGFMGALLGPFSLMTTMVEESFGVDLLKTGKEKIGGLFGGKEGKDKKITKNKPNERDVARIGDMGSLLLYHFFKKKKPEDNEEKKGLGGLLSSLLGTSMGSGGLKKILPALLKGGAIAAIIGSLVWMAIDGITGYLNAEKWGTSKASATIGAVLGGTGSGWKGAFANAGKWGLMGVGIGFLVGGPVGALIGGLLGAAVGGIMGYFGGEKIAKGLDKLWNWFNSIFDFKELIMASAIGSVIRMVDNMKKIWKDDDKSVGEKILATLKGYGTFVIDFALSPFKIMKNLFTLKFLNKKLRKSIIEKIPAPIRDITTSVFSFIGNTVSKSMNKVSSDSSITGAWISKNILAPMGTLFTKAWSGIKNVASWSEANLFKPIGGFITNMFSRIIDLGPDLFNQYIMNPFKNMFAFIGDLFGFIFSGKISIGDILGSFASEDKRNALKETFTSYVTEKQVERGMSSVPSIEDGIVRSDGSFVRISPDDNVYATKKEIKNNITTDSSNSTIDIDGLRSSLLSKLDELITAVIDSGGKIIAPPDTTINLDIFKV